MDGVSLPDRLQSLTFGHYFNQSLVGLTLPSCLQSLTFGNWFNVSLEGVELPSSLKFLGILKLFFVCFDITGNPPPWESTGMMCFYCSWHLRRRSKVFDLRKPLQPTLGECDPPCAAGDSDPGRSIWSEHVTGEASWRTSAPQASLGTDGTLVEWVKVGESYLDRCITHALNMHVLDIIQSYKLELILYCLYGYHYH